MNTLPELKLLILEYLNCVELLNVKLTCTDFNQLITKNIFNKRKLKGFPRPEGYCFAYGSNTNMDDWVKGDMIDHDSIFDGHKIIKMEICDYSLQNDIYMLPKYFTIISHDVPINYWNKENVEYRKSWIDIIEFRTQCLNNLKYRDDDVAYGLIFYLVETYFNYNGKNYVICYIAGYNEDKAYTFKKFKHILSTEDQIKVEWDDNDDDFLLDYYSDINID